MGVKKAKEYFVVIIGGGMVGCLCAAILSKKNIPLAIIENHEPELDWPSVSISSRVSAINMASYRILRNLNIWSMPNENCYAPLRAMEVWDKTGGGKITFDSAEAGKTQLGFIVENREISRLLWNHLKNQNNVDIYSPEKAENIIVEKSRVDIQLPNQALRAKLLVGADGGNSWVRSQVNIKCHEQAYHQKALIAVIKTEKPHRGKAFQTFLSDGILAALPLAFGQHMAIVWSLQEKEADKLALMPGEKVALKIKNAFELKLGDIELQTPLKIFPLVMRHAQQYVQPRVALIGDAAHTIHPLAGQGVNLGFMDAACLAQCVATAKENQKDIGSLRVLRGYERWRKGDNTSMICAMKMFKELFGSNTAFLMQARSLGLNITDKSHWLKNFFMRYAMGDVSDLPKLAQWM